MPANGADIPSMDILPLLERCVALERGAAEFYERLAARFTHDAELRALWSAMAADERTHAEKLETWRALAEREPAERREHASGFAQDVEDLEQLLEETRAAAASVKSADEAFALALALETSEIDTIYTKLLQSSPIARFPDVEETVRRETTGHHEALARVVQRRSRDDGNLLRAALLCARDE